MHQEELKIGEHWSLIINQLPAPFNSFHMDTILTAWLAMLIVIVFSLLVTIKLKRNPSMLQTFAEMVMAFIDDITVGQMGKKGIKHTPLIASLFLFVLVSNLLGQLPWKLIHYKNAEFASPTNDLNVTVALALIVSIYYIATGIIEKRFSYFKHYFQPFWFMFPMNLLEDFTRPLSLSLRLFGNILAGEVILLVLVQLAPIFVPIPMMLFELFVAFIQAFIFATLAASYVAAATNNDH